MPGVPTARQGAGALDAGRSLALALRERHRPLPPSPEVGSEGVVFTLHDHDVRRVEVLGSWDGWRAPGLPATSVEAGLWQTPRQPLPPGRHTYKFLLDAQRWLDDPANPLKRPDGFGGLNSVLDL